MKFHEKKIDLFDFASFFAWTFLNFLAIANYLFCKKYFCTFSGLRSANDNMEKLMTRLEKLSVAIGQLNPASSSKNSPSHSNGGGGMDFGNGNGNHSLNR